MDGNSQLQQRVRDWNSPLSFGYSYRNLGGTASPFTAYTPEHFYEPGHGGILPPIEPLSPGHHQIDYYWTVPAVPGETGLFANVVYLGSKQRQLISQGIPQAIVNSNQVHFTIIHDVSADGTAPSTTVVTVDGVGELYNGSAQVFSPWVTGFSSGLYRLRMTVDGTDKVDESYGQQALIFEHPFPQLTIDNPGDTTITNRFGWSTDDITIDGSLALDNPTWSAGLTSGALHDAPRRPGNEVSFTINALKETLTKHIQAFTTVPLQLGLAAKTTEPNKTLNYYVFAHADAVTDYRLDSQGSLPGYRPMVQVSNIRQTPSPVLADQPTTFSFDVTPINFDTAEMSFELGLGAEASPFFWSASEGVVTKTTNGWHVDVPWTSSRLPNVSGLLEVNLHDTVLPNRSASQQVPFTVALEGQQQGAEINFSDPIVEEFFPGLPIPVNAQIIASGFTTPSYQWTVTVRDELNRPVGEAATGNTSVISAQIDTSDVDLTDVDSITIDIQATVTESSGSDGGGGGAGSPSASAGANQQRQNNSQIPELKISLGSVTLAQMQGGITNTSLLADIHGHPSQRTGANATETWEVTLKDPSFVNATSDAPAPANITYVATGVGGSSLQRTLSWNAGRKLYVDQLPVDFGLLKPPTGSDLAKKGESFSVAQGSNTTIKDEGLIFQNIVFRDTAYWNLGLFFESLHFPGKTPAEEQARQARLLTEMPLTRDQFVNNFGYAVVGVTVGDLSQPMGASVKVGQAANTLLLHLHGDHNSGDMNLTEDAARSPLPSPRVPFDQFQPIDISLSNSAKHLSKIYAISCSPFDINDYNNFNSNAHFPSQGHSPSAGLSQRVFGGQKWRDAFLGVHGGHKVNLFGYNAFAPQKTIKEVAQAYRRYLDNKTPEALAWVKANRDVGSDRSTAGGLYWLCLNACAITPDGYYYIAYDVPNTWEPDANNQSTVWVESPPLLPPGSVPDKGIYFIKAADFKTEAHNWNNIPQTGPGGTTTIGTKQN